MISERTGVSVLSLASASASIPRNGRTASRGGVWTSSEAGADLQREVYIFHVRVLCVHPSSLKKGSTKSKTEPEGERRGKKTLKLVGRCKCRRTRA